MMPRYKQMPLELSQLMLYGQSIEDAVPKDCDVRAYKDVTECLDHSSLESKCCERGCPPYPPEVMVRVLGYAYSKGIRSSRKIEQHLNYDVRFIWLAGGLKPDHNTIARFRKDNWQEFKDLFGHSVRLCCESGLVSINVVSTDGSKIRAAASKKQMYNQDRLEREMAAVEKILQEAEQMDRLEDEEDGGGNTDDKLPKHLRDTKERKARLRQIAKQLATSESKSLDGRRISVSIVEPQRAKIREKLVSKQYKELYALRKQTVEPVFGRIKSNLGMSRFLLYGIKGAAAEASLMCMVHNVLKCMNSAAAMVYVTSTNARVFAADIAYSIQLAFVAATVRIFAVVRRSYAKAQAAF